MSISKPNSIIANGVEFRRAAQNSKAVIAQVLGPDFGKNVYARTHLLGDPEDSLNIMIAVLMKYSTPDINRFVNDERADRNLPPIKIDKRDIYNFKTVYANQIDSAYIAVAKYIGDVHPFADKFHRVGILNDIIEKLQYVKDELQYPDDFTLKKANLLIKALDRMNAEMGKQSAADFSEPRYKPQSDEEQSLTEEQIKKILDDKYSAQLPERKIEDAVIVHDSNNQGTAGPGTT